MARLISVGKGSTTVVSTDPIVADRQAGDDTDIENLLEFIYLMPVAVMQFRVDGAIDLLNPMATQMLMPLLSEADFGNIFVALRDLCPELAGAVASFPDASGTIIDQRRIDGSAGQQNVTLSLNVTRVRPDVHMAVLKDISRLTEMLAYAFASADLLMDVDTDGMIAWAGGAFRSLLAMRPEDAVGKPLNSLIAPRDRDRLSKALMVIGTRGRLSPLFLRLANATESRCVVSGLTLEGASRRFMVTIGPPPAEASAMQSTVQQGREFGTEVESWMRNGQAGMLGLLNIEGWDKTVAGLNHHQRGVLKREIGRLAGETGGEHIVVGELGDGRYGVLGRSDTDLKRLGEALRELVGSFSNGDTPEVKHSRIELDGGSLPLALSVQALRLVLARFGSAPNARLTATGFADGLTGIIEHARAQKRALAGLIGRRRFTLAYQPIVKLADRTVHHYEALLRPARDPDNPADNPQEFVTIVETVGLSQELDLAVLSLALEELRKTDAAVAVNVSGGSIANPSFTRQLLDQAAGTRPGRLLIELTETVEIEDLSAAADQIARIRAAGIPVCLDDFGAGSASFRYLRDLRVDCVKIDGSYVRAASQGDQGRAFVQAMAALATSAGATSVAEMIETEDEAALMSSLCVTYGQGWLFGKPGPIPVPSSSNEVDVGTRDNAARSMISEFSDRFRRKAKLR